MTFICLHIDTSGPILSVAISIDGENKVSKIANASNTHSTDLPKYVTEVLTKANMLLSELNAVSVSAGPGSYTGLRIGLSYAKGVTLGLGIPLIGLSTLRIIENAYREQTKDTINQVVAALDARRNEVYAAIFDEKGDYIVKDAPFECNDQKLLTIINTRPTVLLGSGANKFSSETLINAKIFQVVDYQVAANQSLLAFTCFQNEQFANKATFSPNYTKSFYLEKRKNL